MTGTITATAPPADAPLERWLDWIGAVHPSEMELGLERVTAVARRLGIERPTPVVVTVGGTNGKGSTVRMLESIWNAAGHRTGAATSPHVTRFAERVRVAAREADERDIVAALARVEEARAPDSLTYFEFATLAAMSLFVEAGCEVAIMEVGLGGRLDAVNLWDADCAVLTSVALDHAEWLGTDRARIATEKAAIGRRGRPFVLGEPDPPDGLRAYVEREGFALVDVGARSADELPRTALAGAHQRRNAGCALAAVEALGERLPVGDDVARRALAGVSLDSRFELVGHAGATFVLDVAHNPAAAEALATTWRERLGRRRAVCVFAALADKDIEGIVGPIAPLVDHWCLAALDGPRALPVADLAARTSAALTGADGDGRRAEDPIPAKVERFASVGEALERARGLAAATVAEQAAEPPIVLVVGSFLTIAAARVALGV